MGFKTDESFLEKISIGAIGTKKVFNDLKRMGHKPIELERGSMSFKIWKDIKIKRVRVPDLLCVNCNKRIESRAKTKLLITMSHSDSDPKRGWNFGLTEKDYIAFVVCNKDGDRPIDWKASDLIQYISVKDMLNAYTSNKVIIEKPKGATEGFETRITWPSTIANTNCVITKIDDTRIQYKRFLDDRKITLSLIKKGLKLNPKVNTNEKIIPDQIIASVVDIHRNFFCEQIGSDKYYIELLNSPSLSERYSAAKALALFKSDKSIEALKLKMNDTRDHIFVRLDSALSLIKMGKKDSIGFFEKVLNDDYLTSRLEAVIVLAESKSDSVFNLLLNVLTDNTQHPEIRAGAAWSMGELGSTKCVKSLIRVFNDIDLNVRAEAARALAKIAREFSNEVINHFSESDEEQRAGISWALSKAGNFDLNSLLNQISDEDTKKWIAWILGSQNKQRFISELENIKSIDKEVYFATTVLWKVFGSWINNLEVY